MATTETFAVEKRTEIGSRSCERLRQKGLIPGIVYGHKHEAQPISFARDDLETALRAGARALDLKIGDEAITVVFKEVQYDALGDRILHVDLARVAKGEQLTLDVEIILKGMAKGVKDGGVLVQDLHAVEITCGAESIPQGIVYRVDDLELDAILRLKDIPFPEGVTPTGDPELVIATIRMDEEEEAPAESGEEMKEPEVITAREEKEGEGE